MTSGRQFQMIGGHAALDFINTLDNRFLAGKQEELLSSYADLLSFAEQAGLLTAHETRKLRALGSTPEAESAFRSATEFREAAAELWYTWIAGRSASKRSLATLNRILDQARQHRQVASGKGGFTWVWRRAEDAGYPVWRIAWATAELLTSEANALVRECGRENCRWLFLDQSKNHTRRWCDMKICGNRTKARRFYEKHSAMATS